MNAIWQDFLTQQGATIESGRVHGFGDVVAEFAAVAAGDVLCDLGQFGTLRVSGEEAQVFLQNLLSNDIREVSTSHAQYSSLNTAKGRVLASLLIWRDGADFLLQLPQDLCEPIRKKLGMYVLRAKVKVTDARDEIVTLGFSGANIRQTLQDMLGELPHQPLEVMQHGSSCIMKISDTRFMISATVSDAQELWISVCTKVRPVGGECWDWLNICDGIPVILPQIQEHFVAQMVNMDLIGGVSFNKGCYPGQEIVARTQYLGKLKRRMYLAHIDAADRPQPGDELFSVDMEGQSSGMIVNASPSPAGGYDVLAVVQIVSHDAYPVHLGSLTGERLAFRALPYTLS